MGKRILAACALIAALFAGTYGVRPAAPAEAQTGPCSVVFDFTGGAVNFTVPDGVTQVGVQIFGAAGGDATGSSSTPNISEGGFGAGATGGVITTVGGEAITVIVGQEGGAAASDDTDGDGDNDGGIGGFGYDGTITGAQSGGDGGDAEDYHGGGGGGGASAVLLNGVLVASAGGGGGGSHGGEGGDGGAAGTDGVSGGTGDPDAFGLGATNTAGGAGGAGSGGGDDGTAGASGVGGTGGDAIDTARPEGGGGGDAGGGGGGGQFGGGGAGGGIASDEGGGAGGGGGSSEVNLGDIETGVRDGDGQVILDLLETECPGDVQIEKTVSNPLPTIGEEITYTLVATNNGPADPDPGVVVSDNFPAGVSYVSDDCGGVNDVRWTWEIGDLAIDDPQTCNITVLVEEPGLWTNTAVITGDNPDSDPSNNEASVDISVPSPVYDLEIVKTATVEANGQITYTLTGTNLGPDPTHEPVVVADVLPPEVAYVSDTCGGALPDQQPPGIDGTLWAVGAGPMAVGQTLTCDITVDVVGSGDITNVAVIGTHDSPSVEVNLDNNEDEVTLSSALQIVKTSDPSDAVVPGGTVAYTVTVTNTGDVPYTALNPATFTDDLTAVLDDATFNDDAAADIGTVTFTDPTLSWTGALAPGETATITYSVTVNDPLSGDGVLTNAVVGPPESNCLDGTEDGCTTVVPVRALQIDKTVDPPDEVTPGSTVSYTVTVTNTGQVPYTALAPATFSDDLTAVLDDATFNDDATADIGTVTLTEPTLTWSGALAPGETATITYSVTVNDPPTGDGVLTNAVVGPPESNCDTGTEDGCTTTVQERSLQIVKTVDPPDEVLPGGAVSYTVTVTNTGQVPYTALDPAMFSDDLTAVLDDADFNDDATADAGTVTFTDPELSWSGALAPGETATITYSVTVNDPPTGDGVLTNAVVGPPESNCDTGTEAGCTTSVPVRALEIVKTSDPSDSAVLGGTVSYTVTVTNTGQVPYTALDPATFSDDLTAVLDDATFNDDATVDVGTVTFTDPELSWSGALAPGETATITYSVTVNDPLSGDGVLTNAVVGPPESNCATGTEAGCSTNVPIRALEIVKTSEPSVEVLPGGTMSYTVTVTNTGQFAYTDADPATFSDDLTTVLDDATFNDDATADIGTVTFTGPTLSWSGALAVGATATITYSVTVNDPPTGDGLLANAVVGPPESNCDAGTEAGCTTTVPVRALQIVKTSAPIAVLPGGTVTYTVTVTNTGQVPYTALDPATFSDDLTDVLDDADFNDDAAADIGTVTFTEPTLSWTGALAPGEVATITYSVTVIDPPTGDGDGVLTNAVVGPPESNCDTGTEPDCTTFVPIRELLIVKTVSVEEALPGDTVTYTIEVTNIGTFPFGALFPARFDDDLTAVLDDATFNDDATADVGAVTFTEPVVHWESPLGPGATATITYSVTVNDPPTGDGVLTNVVTGPPVSNCDPASEGFPAADCTTEVPVRALQIVKTSAPMVVLPGGALSYTVTVTNTGQVPYTDADPASFTDDLTAVLDDATYNNDATADLGVASFAEPELSWSGALAVGETATITYSVTVNDPLTGDGELTNAVVGPPESQCDTGTEDDCTTNVPVRALAILKTAGPDGPTEAGSTVAYTITVTNIGQAAYTTDDPATFTDDLTAVLDDATFNNDAAADIGAVTFTNPTLAWAGALGPGDVATITYSVTVNDPLTGDGDLANAVVGPPESNCTGPVMSLSSPVLGFSGSTMQLLQAPEMPPGCQEITPVRAFDIRKTDDAGQIVTAGDTVTYTVTVTNTGQVPYTDPDPATFSDDLTAVLDDATFNNDASSTAGTVSFSTPILTWTGPVDVGGTITVTYSVTVNDPVSGDGTITNIVTPDAASGGTCRDDDPANCAVSSQTHSAPKPPAPKPPGPLPLTGSPLLNSLLTLGVALLALGAVLELIKRRARRRPRLVD